MMFPLSARAGDAFHRRQATAILLLLVCGSSGCRRPPPPAPLNIETRPGYIPGPYLPAPVQPAKPPAGDEPTPPAPASPVSPSPGLTPAWRPKAKSRDWQHIVLHHTATGRGSVESIHETHLQRKDSSGNPWLGIGYHFVIGNGNGMTDGMIEPTFRWRQQLHGAHAGSLEHNQHGIGIVLVGNFDETPPTAAQLTAVRRLLRELTDEYGIDPENVIGHSDVKATRCPGRHFPLDEIRRQLVAESVGSSRGASRTVAGAGSDLRRSLIR